MVAVVVDDMLCLYVTQWLGYMAVSLLLLSPRTGKSAQFSSEKQLLTGMGEKGSVEERRSHYVFPHGRSDCLSCVMKLSPHHQPFCH